MTTSLKIHVLGGGKEVGRAAILLEYRDTKILLDYGVSFDEKDLPVLPLSVKPTLLDAVIVTHAHLDHVGAAPMLYVSASPAFISTHLTVMLSRIMIEDLIKLSGYYLPFEYPELISLLRAAKGVEYEEEIRIKNAAVTLYDAGHIPGSASVNIDFGDLRVFYTGDTNVVETKMSKNKFVDKNLKSDILIIESTYGDSEHPPRHITEDLFIKVVREVIDEGGNVLIPAFALARAQEILALLAERLDYADVYYDGLARTVLELYLSNKHYINRSDLLEKASRIFAAVTDSSMRRKIARGHSNIIVAPAGMLKGGPALYYLKKMIDHRKNAIILVSYQAPTSTGWRLLTEGLIEDGVSVKSRIYWFDFSSHAGSSDLKRIVRSLKDLEEVIIIHGSEESASKLAGDLREELGVNVHVPRTGETIELNF